MGDDSHSWLTIQRKYIGDDLRSLWLAIQGVTATWKMWGTAVGGLEILPTGVSRQGQRLQLVVGSDRSH